MKSIQKSVRLTPRVYKIVDEYRGEGFNEKYCNMVLDFAERREQLVLDWNNLQAAIADKRQELQAIKQHVKSAYEVDRRFSALVSALAELLDE